jgi:hypothetical protein
MTQSAGEMEGPELEKAIEAVRAEVDHYSSTVAPQFSHLEGAEERIIDAALLTRTAPLVESVLMLAEAGYGREALMLNRPLFEYTVDAYWTEANRSLASDRFLAHARYTQHLQRQVFRRYPQLGVTVREESLDEDEVKAGIGLFGRHASQSWTGAGLPKRLESMKTQLDPLEHGQLDFVFEVLHDLTNAELHPSAWSLGRALRYSPDGKGGRRLQYRSGPEQELAAFALGYTWWIFLKALDRMHGLLGLETEPLQAVADVGADLLQLRPAPENGPV